MALAGDVSMANKLCTSAPRKCLCCCCTFSEMDVDTSIYDTLYDKEDCDNANEDDNYSVDE
eukprot:9459373-Ditylum_brightwellii.AAC.1